MKNKLMLCTGLLWLITGTLAAPSPSKAEYPQAKIPKKNKNKFINKPASLFQFGVAEAFVNGVYEGNLSLLELKQHGNFGIGAPNNIDGELTMLDGKVYQTNSKGETFEAPDNLESPFVFVTTITVGLGHTIEHIGDIQTLFNRIEQLLPNKNKVYAIRVTGSFNTMKTRAFSPVTKRPFKPLAQLLDQQHIFDLGSTNGTMVGFYIPGYLSGLNIVGLHFHYLSADFKRGGHLLNLSAENAEVEIAELEGLHLTVPNSLDFQHYDFSQGNSKALEVIEKGKH